MMKSLDAGIGRVLDALKAAGLERNTLVIFTSDNGGERFSYNWPFRGQKMDLFEGGVRVPAIVRWPGVTAAGRVSHQPVITMDWTATMIAAAGNKPDPGYSLDGVDLTNMLKGKEPIRDRTFFWRTYLQGAVRSGKWKYVREGTKELLFDLSTDEREQADFAASQPAVLKRLRDDFNKWESEMAEIPDRRRLVPDDFKVMRKIVLSLMIISFVSCSIAQDAVKNVDEFIAEEMARQKIPGVSLAIVKDGKPLLVKGYGFANLEHQVAVKPDTVFQSGLVGKQFIAFGVMLLVEEGKIALDEKIGKYLGDVPEAWSNITIRPD